MRREADLAQKKMTTTRRSNALEKSESKLYPALSKRNHIDVEPRRTKPEVFGFLHNITSAAEPPPRVWWTDFPDDDDDEDDDDMDGS